MLKRRSSCFKIHASQPLELQPHFPYIHLRSCSSLPSSHAPCTAAAAMRIGRHSHSTRRHRLQPSTCTQTLVPQCFYVTFCAALPPVFFCDVSNRYKAACYLTGITLFVTILLIGSGWSFIRSTPPPSSNLEPCSPKPKP